MRTLFVQVNSKLCGTAVFVCGGATWIWKLVSHYYPKAVQIVDWYHAEDRLKRIADEAFSALEERQAWKEKITENLWQGKSNSSLQPAKAYPKNPTWQNKP